MVYSMFQWNPMHRITKLILVLWCCMLWWCHWHAQLFLSNVSMLIHVDVDHTHYEHWRNWTTTKLNWIFRKTLFCINICSIRCSSYAQYHPKLCFSFFLYSSIPSSHQQHVLYAIILMVKKNLFFNSNYHQFVINAIYSSNWIIL